MSRKRDYPQEGWLRLSISSQDHPELRGFTLPIAGEAGTAPKFDESKYHGSMALRRSACEGCASSR